VLQPVVDAIAPVVDAIGRDGWCEMGDFVPLDWTGLTPPVAEYSHKTAFRAGVVRGVAQILKEHRDLDGQLVFPVQVWTSASTVMKT
jgi:hypothetical protein